MKAVLMNSAAKTSGWDNGQVAHPNGNGGVLTAQGLDNRVGAGRMDLNRAFEQLLWGTADVAGTAPGNLGPVNRTGWDFGLVAEGTNNDYLINQILPVGSKITATLDWFRDRTTVGDTSFSDASYDNLDLELWEAVGWQRHESHRRIQEPLQQQRALQLQAAEDCPVSVARPLDLRAVRPHRRRQQRTLRPGVVSRRAGAGDDHAPRHDATVLFRDPATIIGEF